MKLVAGRAIMIGRVIDAAGMIGVLARLVLFTFGLVLLLFRRGFGFDIASAFRGLVTMDESGDFAVFGAQPQDREGARPHRA